jgi:hypothetical protein
MIFVGIFTVIYDYFFLQIFTVKGFSSDIWRIFLDV